MGAGGFIPDKFINLWGFELLLWGWGCLTGAGAHPYRPILHVDYMQINTLYYYDSVIQIHNI